jgi:polyphosphate kinase
MLDVNLKAPEYYINRGLSFLDFNSRVLAQAHDEALPLLERIRFLGISCSNLDEFFEIRVAGLKQRLELGSLGGGPDGMSVPEQLTAIHERAMAMVKDQYDLLNHLVFPALAAHGIQFVNGKTFTPRQHAWLAEYFAKEVEPVLTPL